MENFRIPLVKILSQKIMLDDRDPLEKASLHNDDVISIAAAILYQLVDSNRIQLANHFQVFTRFFLIPFIFL